MQLIVVYLLILVPWGVSEGTGTSLMEVEFLAVLSSGTSTEPEIIWWYFCTGGEVEWMEFTAVRYLIQ